MKQHIVRIAALGLSTTAILGAGTAFSAGHAATTECTAGSTKLVETIAAVTHTESRYAKTVPGAHHDAVTHVVHHAAETHDEVAPGGYAYTQRTTGKVAFKDSDSWNPGNGWDRTPALDTMVTVVDKEAWDETVVDTPAYDEPDTILYYTGKPAGSTNIEDAAWVRYAPTGWPSKVETRTVTDVPETYVCDFVRPVTTLINPTPLVRSGFAFDLQTTDNHMVTKTVGNIYRDGVLFKSFQSPGDSLSVTLDLPDGAYTLRYNGLDSVGNVASTSTYDFVVDGTGPTVTDKGTAGSPARAKSFKLFDARKVDKVAVNGVVTNLADNTWSDLNDVVPGRYGAVEGKNSLVAYDRAGNASAPVDFVLDTTGPVVTDKGTAGAAGQKKSFKLHDPRRVDKVVINGVTKDLTNNVWSDVNDIVPGRYGAVEGVNSLVAYDELGNTTEVTFVLDVTGPTVTDKGTDGAIARSKSYHLHDRHEIDKVTVNGVTKDLANDNWSDVNDIVPGRFGGVEGKNTLIAYDEAGNASAPVDFVLDTTGPSITEKDGSSSSNRSFKIDDGALGARVAGVRVNGTDFPLSPNRWSDANGLSVGSFWGVRAGENTLVAYDTLGNETTVTFTIAAPVDESDESPVDESPVQHAPADEPTVDTAAPTGSTGGSGSPSDAGPVATTETVAGPKASAATAFAPELARSSFAGDVTQAGAATDVALTSAAATEEVDTVRIAAATPPAVDESLPGLGIAAVAGGGILALGGVLALRSARRRA